MMKEPSRAGQDSLQRGVTNWQGFHRLLPPGSSELLFLKTVAPTKKIFFYFKQILESVYLQLARTILNIELAKKFLPFFYRTSKTYSPIKDSKIIAQKMP